MPGKLDVDGIEFGGGFSLTRVGGSLRLMRRGVTVLEINPTGLGLLGTTPAAQGSAYTQTFSTADKTHAAATAADAAAATATSIAAAMPAAAPAGGTGATAGAYDTAANRDAAIVTINDLRTHAIEMDLDYEAILVDVADIRTQFNAVRVDLDDLKRLVNSVIDDLQSLGLVG